MTIASDSGKEPRQILPQIFAFAPNRETLGGTAYLIVRQTGNIAIDCPQWSDRERNFLLDKGVDTLIITHRGGMGKKVSQIQSALNCRVIVQEQEAYLLPEVEVTSFREEFFIDSKIKIIWTSGHSPGSCCVYFSCEGGILFSGRHLLPLSIASFSPLRTQKTFHWWRQLNSVAKLRDMFNEDTLKYVLPGANTGFLRGQGYIDNAYSKLTQLDLEFLKSVSVK